MDMRLGKTLVTIEWAIRRGMKRVLVLCPKTAIVSWKNELEKETIEYCILETREDKFTAIYKNTDAGWYLTSLATILTIPLWKGKWDCIVIDESSRMKNPRAKVTNRLLRFYSRIPHRILLSGTPTPEDITESITQIIFIKGSCLGCQDYWAFRYKHMKLIGYDWVLKQGVYEKLKDELHEVGYFLNQKDAGWDTTTIKEKIYFALNPIQKKYIKQLLDHFEMETGQGLVSTKYIMAQSLWMSQVASGYCKGEIINTNKLYWLVRYLGAKNKLKVVVWFRFNDELKYVANVLIKFGFKTRIMTAESCPKLEDRILIQKEFQAGNIDVLCIQIKMGQYALDLSRADEAIYYTNSYSGEERIQSEKRICHTARITPPKYKDLIFKDSIEEEILDSLQGKSFSLQMIWNKLRLK